MPRLILRMTVGQFLSLVKYHRYFDFTISFSNSLTNSSFVPQFDNFFPFLSKQVLDCIRSINDFTTKFWPGSLTRNYLIYSFPAKSNSAVKIIFCISVVKKTDLGYVNKYIDATLIYMYMPSYLQNAVEHPSREFHCMGMFRESNKISGEKSI